MYCVKLEFFVEYCETFTVLMIPHVTLKQAYHGDAFSMN